MADSIHEILTNARQAKKLVSDQIVAAKGSEIDSWAWILKLIALRVEDLQNSYIAEKPKAGVKRTVWTKDDDSLLLTIFKDAVHDFKIPLDSDNVASLAEEHFPMRTAKAVSSRLYKLRNTYRDSLGEPSE